MNNIRHPTALLALVVCSLIAIAAISVHDAMLLALSDQVIHETEQNPIGRWLITLGGGEVWLFIAIKLAGTTTACTAIAAMFTRWPKQSLTIASSVACFQGALLVYLSCY